MFAVTEEREGAKGAKTDAQKHVKSLKRDRRICVPDLSSTKFTAVAGGLLDLLLPRRHHLKPPSHTTG